jgi:Cof subfamily protein (haloacid dehalogenase superfamily)
MIDTRTLKKLKLIVLDLDGTLLNDAGEIAEDSVRLIRELQKKGVKFTFASGRLFSALTQYAKELNLSAPLITMDGAFIKEFPDGKIISETYMPESKVKKAVAYAEQFLVKFAICHPDSIYYTEHNAIVPDLIDKFGAKFEEIDSYDHLLDKTLEILFISDMRKNLKYIKKMLSFPYTFGLITSYSKSLSNEGLYYLEVKKKGSTKASGLLRLVKYLKISIHETAVIGDWYNDISLFETGAVKVALENAVGDLKDRADIITKLDNNNGGIAEFLEAVLKAK